MLCRSAIVAVAMALTAHATSVLGVFTLIDDCMWSNGGYEYPAALPLFPSWMTTLLWTIDGSQHHVGDKVVLDMPCVFKLTASLPKFSLAVGNENYADCTFFNGEDVSDLAQLKCTITKAPSKGSSVKGKVTVPLAFNAGLTGSDIDSKCAKAFSPQDGSFTFTDGANNLTGKAKFEGFSGKLYSLQRTLPSLGKALFFVNTEDNCDQGYDNGVLGVTLENAIDCDTVTAGFASKYNAFGYLEEYTTEFPHSVECLGNSLTLRYNNVPTGYTPFIAGRSQLTSEGHQYTDRYTCKGITDEEDRSSIKIFKGYDNADISTEGKLALKVGDDNSTKPEVSPDQPIAVVYETTIDKVTVTKTCDLCAHETVTVQVPCEVWPTVLNGKVGFITTEIQPPPTFTESDTSESEATEASAPVEQPTTSSEEESIPTEEPAVIQNIMEGARVPIQQPAPVDQGPPPSPTTTTTRTVPPTEVPCDAGEGCDVKTAYQEVICKGNYCEMTTVSYDIPTTTATPTTVTSLTPTLHADEVPTAETSLLLVVPPVSSASGEIPAAQLSLVPVFEYEGAGVVTMPRVSLALMAMAAMLLL